MEGLSCDQVILAKGVRHGACPRSHQGISQPIGKEMTES